MDRIFRLDNLIKGSEVSVTSRRPDGRTMGRYRPTKCDGDWFKISYSPGLELLITVRHPLWETFSFVRPSDSTQNQLRVDQKPRAQHLIGPRPSFNQMVGRMMATELAKIDETIYKSLYTQDLAATPNKEPKNMRKQKKREWVSRDNENGLELTREETLGEARDGSEDKVELVLNKCRGVNSGREVARFNREQWDAFVADGADLFGEEE